MFKCSRRQVLRLASAAAILAAAGALQACGGTANAPASSSPGSPPATTSKPAASSAAAAPSSSAASPSSAAAKAAMPSFTIAYPGVGGFDAPIWVADATKAFSDSGVSVSVRSVDSSAAVPALVAREVDAILLSAAPVVTADLNGKLDLVFVASVLNHATAAFYSATPIQSAGDLKGKSVATDRPGTPTDYSTHVLLSKMGLKPSDVNLLAIGGSDKTLAALLSGQVPVANVSPPQSFFAESKGFRELKNIYDVPYQGVGIVMSRSRLGELASVVPNVLKGLRRGIQAYNDQPDLAMRVLGQYTKESDSTVLKKNYDFYRTQAPFELSMQPTMEGIQNMIDFLADTLPAAKSAKAEQFVDKRFLGQLS